MEYHRDFVYGPDYAKLKAEFDDLLYRALYSQYGVSLDGSEKGMSGSNARDI